MGEKSLSILVVLFFSCAAHVWAGELGRISLQEAERLAVQNSPQIAAQQYSADSAYQQAGAQKLKRLPTLSLNAQSMFVSKIGAIDIPQISLTKTVGSHTNWSVSPTLSFVVWDTGQILNKAKSLQRTADASKDTLDYDKRQVLLGARTSYIGVQLAKEQVRLVKEALALAKAQYSDVFNKFKAGTTDKFDLTVAHEEVVDREKDLEQAAGELLVSKRAFAAALGIQDEIERAESLDVDPIKTSLDLLAPKSNTAFEAEEHPQVKALDNQKRASEFSAKSVVAKYFPEISLTGSAGYEYPNLGENITVQQNRLTLGLQMPIFEWGRIWKETKSQKYNAKSYGEQKRQTVIDLTKDVSETRDWIETYKKLQAANVKAVKDAVEVAKLSFDSYQIGKIIFLDVQRANVKALSVKVDAARNDANLAAQISKLLALTEGVEDVK